MLVAFDQCLLKASTATLCKDFKSHMQGIQHDCMFVCFGDWKQNLLKRCPGYYDNGSKSFDNCVFQFSEHLLLVFAAT